jgi:hypothetical protein
VDEAKFLMDISDHMTDPVMVNSVLGQFWFAGAHSNVAGMTVTVKNHTWHNVGLNQLGHLLVQFGVDVVEDRDSRLQINHAPCPLDLREGAFKIILLWSNLGFVNCNALAEN